MSVFLVTGTDTDVGKTTVSCALLAAASARGMRTACFKPAESGCARSSNAAGELHPSDAHRLLQTTNSGQKLADVCWYRLAAPLAPAIAAEKESVIISFAAICERVTSFAAAFSAPDTLLLIEAAGGLLVPYGDDGNVADLAVALGFPLIVVARTALGTINHTLLTLEAARHRDLEIAGVVFNTSRASGAAAVGLENAKNIESEWRRTQAYQIDSWDVFSRQADHQDDAALAASAECELSLDRLFGKSFPHAVAAP